jgi:hypothetical protein
MNRRLILSLALAALLCLAAATALAAPNWTTLHEDQNSIFQVDYDRLTFSGEAPDRQVELWMKSLGKNGAVNFINRYKVKEKGLSFALMEQNLHLKNGQIVSFINKTEKWTETTASSPIGAVATRLFAEQAQNPAAFPPAAAEPGQQPVDQPAAAAPQAPKFTPQEIKQALDDDRIKQEEKDGSKWYRVRDTHTIYYGLSNHRLTADFCLFTYANAKPKKHLNITLSDTRSGTHSAKTGITVKIDGSEWRLNALSTSPGVGGSGSASFTYYYSLPDSLVDAIFAAKNGVTVKWQYMYGGTWKDLEYTIPDKIVRDIQIMYAGCK